MRHGPEVAEDCFQGNYEMVWMYKNQIKDLWTERIKILLKPSYMGSSGEER